MTPLGHESKKLVKELEANASQAEPLRPWKPMGGEEADDMWGICDIRCDCFIKV